MVPTRSEANLPIYLSLSKIWILASPLLTQMHNMVLNSSIWEEGAEQDRNVKGIIIIRFHKKNEKASQPLARLDHIIPGVWCRTNIWMCDYIFYSSSRCWDIVNIRDKQKKNYFEHLKMEPGKKNWLLTGCQQIVSKNNNKLG